jgi:SAM-dependent methyltransferase
MRYAPEFFNRTTFDEARAVVLTPGGGMGTDERWKVETDWLAERIRIPGDGLIVDYGCGVGRVSKLFERPTLGVDISFYMLRHAETYVNRKNFAAVSPEAFDAMVDAGLRADGAFAIWSLQHVLDLEKTVRTLMTGIAPGGWFWLLDLCERNVPAMDGGRLVMMNDRKDVLDLIRPWCELVSEEPLDIWRETPRNGGVLRLFTRMFR